MQMCLISDTVFNLLVYTVKLVHQSQLMLKIYDGTL